jgi:hypothetical protein
VPDDTRPALTLLDCEDMPFAEAFRQPVRTAIAEAQAGSGDKIHDGADDRLQRAPP